MKLFFDFFIDTKEKRFHLCMLFTITICILVLIPYIVLSVYLISLTSYDSIFNLLKEPILEYTYISRVILDAISIATYQLNKVIYLILNNIRWYEIICMVFVLLCYPSIKKKSSVKIALFLLIGEALAILVLVYIGMHATSLANALIAIHSIGYLIGVISILICILLFFHLLQHVRGYQDALQYKVIEIKEHTVIDK